MNPTHKELPNSFRLITLLVLLAVVIAACSAGSPAETSAPEPALSPTMVNTPTVVVPPTETPVAPKILLIAPGDTQVLDLAEVSTAITEFASNQGMEFESREQLLPAEIDQDIKIVVVYPPDPGVGAMAQTFPETKFISVGIPGLNPGPNLALLSSGDSKSDAPGFLAGYMAAVVTQDWRTGVISTGDTAGGKAARNGFINGVKFFCGLCRTVVPPFLDYPVYYDIPQNATAENYQAAADFMISQAVKTVYIHAAVADSQLLDRLAEAGINLILNGQPPPNVTNSWIATVGLDLESGLLDYLESISQGESAPVPETKVIIQASNEQLISPGKLQLVSKMLQDLNNGFIDTGVDSSTGELK